MDNVLPLSDAAAFRRWMEANHDSQRECWLELLRGRPGDDSFYYLLSSTFMEETPIDFGN